MVIADDLSLGGGCEGGEIAPSPFLDDARINDCKINIDRCVTLFLSPVKLFALAEHYLLYEYTVLCTRMNRRFSFDLRGETVCCRWWLKKRPVTYCSLSMFVATFTRKRRAGWMYRLLL